MRAAHNTRRYVIHSDRFITCTLVHERMGGWHVEKIGAAGERVRLTVREFERGDTGKRLAAQLNAALAEAQNDL